MQSKDNGNNTTILLVHAAVKNSSRNPHATKGIPLGLAYIASTLISNGFHVETIDMNLPFSDIETLRKRIRLEQPLILGISTTTPTYPNALRIATLTKNVDPNITVVLGGPHVTILPRDALSHEAVDIIIRGEGEYTMLDLANHYTKGTPPFEEIQGISFVDEGKIISTEDRPLILDLDSLPFPARELFPLSLYPYPGTILTSRGCSGRCIFCSVPVLTGCMYRMRSPQNVVNELLHLHDKLHMRYFVFIDDTFTMYSTRVTQIHELIQKSGLDIRWECSTRVDMVTKELLENMAKAGCIEVQYGVESGSQRVLNDIGKGITLKQVEKAVQWTKDTGMSTLCYFMIPHPSDDVETINETRWFIQKLINLGAEVSVSFTVPYPGTDLYEKRTRYGVRIESNDWSDFDATKPVMSTKNLSLTEINALYDELAFSSKVVPNEGD